MSNSASDGIYSPLCNSDYDCSFPSLQLSAHFDDNSEDIKSTGSKGGDDPDSAELFHASDQDSCLTGSDNSAACDMPCLGKTTVESHQRNVVSG